ncbi:hypothetical protein [Herbiconiux sp. YIM B11900]|uniref:hypothetical protein n=1 Tax=Herbiconiux sp. YIM B11900 TaxID=3404131 RepID=UPI003F86D5DC
MRTLCALGHLSTTPARHTNPSAPPPMRADAARPPARAATHPRRRHPPARAATHPR